MPSKQRVILMFIFGLGFFVCITSILRLHFLIILDHSSDPTWDQPATAYWSAVELNFAIVCACLPTLKPLVTIFAPKALGTNSSSSNPHRSSYRMGSNRLDGRYSRSNPSRLRSNNTLFEEDDEFDYNNSHDMQDVEITGGKSYDSHPDGIPVGYFNSLVKDGKPSIAGIQTTTVIQQNVEIRMREADEK